MSIDTLHIQHFRNITAAKLQFHPRINLFFGENGAGKTSVLEAISLLGRGRSFRSHKLKPLIQTDQPSVVVFGVIKAQGRADKLGVERNRRSQDQFRLNGEAVGSAAELAKVLPVQSIYADTFELITGGPGERRQFLDWLVFHVEQQFFPAWQQVRRALKQRNSLLRSGRIEASALAVWDSLLAKEAGLLDQCRQQAFTRFKDAFNALKGTVPALADLTLEYHRGWPADQNLVDVLQEGLDRDRASGYTLLGPHRADLRIRLNRAPAEEFLSRGQQKILACALKISAGQVFQQTTHRTCVYLLDDLPAELDEEHRQLLAQWLLALDAQIFVTGIDPGQLTGAWQALGVSFDLFHVEQGVISKLEQNNG
ncbi:DNA replication/repair protein RecF [Simiduia agarivorans]|uniref:DNA replication and repair protein RecF n=1 Tax=Simiduia agarivorans (strain DSM 21679 / JCM 13881 / BCRC 17597 / SA1) TaxID=1117647 RepID=K4KKI1_SIMAS|nr:DNA replication/repair protein RecF [Simiduia agarivorans]AFU99644.1 recombination protein F [Simiduia agarivorans SA1 = DSM 21679]